MDRRISLEQLTVESPCPVAWDSMKGDDRVRYCDHCNLHVHNLSSMTRPEAEALFNRPEQRVCVTMWKSADGTVLTRELPPEPRGLRRRLSRMSAGIATLLAFLTGAAAPGCRSSGASAPNTTTTAAPPIRQEVAPAYPNTGAPAAIPAGVAPNPYAGGSCLMGPAQPSWPPTNTQDGAQTPIMVGPGQMSLPPAAYTAKPQ